MTPGYLRIILAAIVIASMSACGEEATTPAATPVTKNQAPQAKKVAPPPAEEATEKIPEYAYDPLGRRDPFTPLLVMKNPALSNTEPQTPLQSFELGQLRLIAIIIGKGPASAMVMAPDGKGYILKEGIRVGKNNGIVIGINPQAVLVKEKYMDFSGEVMEKTQEIQLPMREGA